MFCSKCGVQQPDDSVYCSNCGAKLEAELEETVAPPQNDSVPTVVETSVYSDDERILGKKKGKKGLVVALLLVVIAVGAAIIWAVTQLIGGLSSAGETLVYISENEYQLLKQWSAEANSIELEDNVIHADVSDYFSPQYLGNSVVFSEDGAYLYFVSGIRDTTSEVSGSLYCAELSKLKADSGKNSNAITKIDSNVWYYLMKLPNGQIAYETVGKNGGDLHLITGTSSEKIASNCWNVEVTEDGKRLYYTTNDPSDYSESLYTQLIADVNSKEKIASDIYLLEYFDNEGVLYSKRDDEGELTIYAYTPGGSPQKLLNGVSGISSVSSINDFYYTKSTTTEEPLYNFVIDGCAAEDASVVEPQYSDYRVEETYVNYWGNISTRTTTDYDAYYAAYDVWRAANARNNLRSNLRNNTNFITEYEIYHFEKGNSTQICAEVGSSDFLMDTTTGLLIYSKNDNLTPVLKIQEIDGIYDVQNWLWEQIPEKKYYRIGGGDEKVLDEDISLLVSTVDSGTQVILENTDQEIISYTIGKDGLTNRTHIADGYARKADDSFAKDTLIIYETQGDTCDYWKWTPNGGKVRIIDDARELLFYEDGLLLACTDYDYAREEASLYSIDKDGTKTKIADDVSTVRHPKKDVLLMISDGDLYLYKGKEKTRIATDVDCFWCANDLQIDSY